jgi:hypothetical protein
MSGKKSFYLELARLGEVLSLIQVLAYHKGTREAKRGWGDSFKENQNQQVHG